MYEIRREGGRVLITKGTTEILNAPDGSYIVYKDQDVQKVTKVKDLPDEKLLLALANVIRLDP